MGWQSVVVLNFVIASCYVVISALIATGLIRTRQAFSNPLALATAAIFATCAVHHGHHSLHLLHGAGHHDLVAVRAVFGEWHSILIDALGAVVAVTYLGLRRTYKALLNTPAMFEDAVRVAAERRLGELAYTDGLTQVPNRAAYQQFADALVPDGLTVTVCFVDLDGFKAVNDTYGHDAGDRLLREMAQRLAAGLTYEHLFRLGGDEFVVVAVDLDATAGQALAHRLARVVAQPVAVREREIVISASIGVATGTASKGVDRLLREADVDMYRIKGLTAGERRARILVPVIGGNPTA